VSIRRFGFTHANVTWAAARSPRPLRLLRSGLLGLCLIMLTTLLAAPCANAADRIYWSNYDGNSIAYADLNGDGGGGAVDTSGATVNGPMGLAIDPSRETIYWANWAGDTGTTISYANLEGGGGGDLDIQGATVNGPHGLAIDPSIGPGGRLYWANYAGNSISYADLDGAGAGTGGDLTITNATVDGPRGVTIDPVANRLYWSNFSAGDGTTISYASLDGGSDGNLLQVGTTGEGPEGTAIDPVDRKIYWSDYGAYANLAYANVDGSNVQHFSTYPATTAGVHGVALEPMTRRLYWANYSGNSISSASLHTQGEGQDLDTSGTTVNGPNLPALLEAPAGVGAPQVSGGSEPGSTLSCPTGAWAGDIIESLLYRAPHEFAYQWSLDGQDLSGAQANSITAIGVGKYRCRVTARNAAGATDQTSEPHAVSQPSPKTKLTKKPKRKIKTKKKSAKVKVSFTSKAGATFKCKLDKAKLRPCTSPYSVKAKSKGGKGKQHTISVQATDGDGYTENKPATVSFTVIRTG
jgi:hypothetical protein